eukprot:scaffold7247_cov143-Skeletonema_menzelii.AAC.6
MAELRNFPLSNKAMVIKDVGRAAKRWMERSAIGRKFAESNVQFQSESVPVYICWENGINSPTDRSRKTMANGQSARYMRKRREELVLVTPHCCQRDAVAAAATTGNDTHKKSGAIFRAFFPP